MSCLFVVLDLINCFFRVDCEWNFRIMPDNYHHPQISKKQDCG